MCHLFEDISGARVVTPLREEDTGRPRLEQREPCAEVASQVVPRSATLGDGVPLFVGNHWVVAA